MGVPLLVLNSSWAQLIERLSDVWGRGVRYGDGPAEPNRIALGTFTHESLLEMLMLVSDEIDLHERDLVRADQPAISHEQARSRERLDELRRMLEALEDVVRGGADA